MLEDADDLAEISAASGVDAATLAGVETDIDDAVATSETDLGDQLPQRWLEEINEDERQKAARAVSYRLDTKEAYNELAEIKDARLAELVKKILLLQIGEHTSLADREVAEELLLDAVDQDFASSLREWCFEVVKPFDFVFYNKDLLMENIRHAGGANQDRPDLPRDLLRIAAFEDLAKPVSANTTEVIESDLGRAAKIMSTLYGSQIVSENNQRSMHAREFTKARLSAEDIVHQEIKEQTLKIIGTLEAACGLGEYSLYHTIALAAVNECIGGGDFETAMTCAVLLEKDPNINYDKLKRSIEDKMSRKDSSAIKFQDVRASW